MAQSNFETPRTVPLPQFMDANCFLLMLFWLKEKVSRESQERPSIVRKKGHRLVSYGPFIFSQQLFLCFLRHLVYCLDFVFEYIFYCRRFWSLFFSPSF